MAGRFKGFCHFPCFQTLPPSRAPQARGKACVTVFERRSHLGPPAEGRQGPSDDNGDDFLSLLKKHSCSKINFGAINKETGQHDPNNNT